MNGYYEKREEMSNYGAILKATLYADFNSHIFFFGIALLILLLVFILKKLMRKNWNVKRLCVVCVIVMAVSIFEIGWLCIPKILDLKENSFVTMQGVYVYSIGEGLDYGPSLYGGRAYINVPGDETIELHGTLYIEEFQPASSSPNSDENGVYANVVYAKHSGQLIKFEEIT